MGQELKENVLPTAQDEVTETKESQEWQVIKDGKTYNKSDWTKYLNDKRIENQEKVSKLENKLTELETRIRQKEYSSEFDKFLPDTKEFILSKIDFNKSDEEIKKQFSDVSVKYPNLLNKVGIDLNENNYKRQETKQETKNADSFDFSKATFEELRKKALEKQNW